MNQKTFSQSEIRDIIKEDPDLFRIFTDRVERRLEKLWCEISKRLAEEYNHVFQYIGEPIKSIKTSFKTACEKAKIPYGQKKLNGVVSHDFRHTSITDMRRAGVDPSVNRAWHGHSLRDAHGGYHTIDLGDLKRAGEILQEYRTAQVTKNVTQKAREKDAKMENVTQFVTQILF